MKKSHFAGYLFAAMLVGTLIGGGFAWALGTSARVAFGTNQAGIVYLDENTVLVQIFKPKDVKSVENIGAGRVQVNLK